MIKGFKVVKAKDPTELPDMCGCEICDWKGKVSDCETEQESEGWEYPEYTIHICPRCGDNGAITDYWFSKERP